MQLNSTLEEENRALMDQVNKLLAQVQVLAHHIITEHTEFTELKSE